MDAKWQADRLSLQGELPSPSQRRSALAASLSSPPRITFWAGLLSVAVVILMGQKLYAELDTIDDAYMRWSYSRADLDPTSDNGICAQQAPYKPTFEIAPHPGVDVLAQRLSGAIRVDTSVGDDWPKVSDDPEKWAKVLDPFRDYLKNTFPKVHSQDSPLTLELVNDQGLLYTWKGSDEKLKPLLLLGHQDVVPVNPATLDEWWHAPFDGVIDVANETVWGRGATDDKSSLISIMSSLEALVEADFKPKRTVLASFGFDEESGGREGAPYLAKRVEEIYGKDSIAMIVDEGNPVLAADNPIGPGFPVALPAVQEKGHADIRMKVSTAGGHSSTPPQHTSIGLLAKLITELEAKPYPIELDERNAHLQFLQCTRDGPRVSPKLRQALRDLEWANRHRHRRPGVYDRRGDQRLRRAKQRVIDNLDEFGQTSFRTTQAVDLIQGGVKVNALPESAEAVINHRIDVSHGSVKGLQDDYRARLFKEAKRMGLQMYAFGEKVDMTKCDYNWSPSYGCASETAPLIGTLTLEIAFDAHLEPAPKSPLEGSEAGPWKLLAGVIRNTWRGEDGESILVAPSLMMGNTDTKEYGPTGMNLTKHVFRFDPATIKPDKTGLGAISGTHTVNEQFAMDGMVKGTEFYTTLIQAASETDV